ncbi:MAG TPA: NADP-dependent phosphogluconate dehydrogenase [Aggregatilinea sp.]|uniref:NADP-dependent phosphogluconate dehydrogenase n=1 Tax=Aggregatilinea sp. TaxID=2806333 RepID=UPI002BE885C6|nr:NADP-dependent phosphogluconate dehydrogenase [Aggregatilinea sp.]HML21079.1 NADP-dependent phosphogluconate dehydrogenase [Aggregatilinea sp.]
MGEYAIGMVGLGVMGANLARNFVSKGFSVAGYDLAAEKREAFDRYASEGDLKSFADVQDFLGALEQPRRIILLVPSSVVDEAIGSLKPMLNEGDLLIDLGNSFFGDTERRAVALEDAGYYFIGSGVSGGEKGALRGPSIMPGGHREAYALIAPAFEAIAAKVDGDPCVTYIGPRGAGHYVKMVHNGIEYGIMQLIAEAYDLLKRGVDASADELAAAFRAWNHAELNSYLVQITGEIFARRDPDTGTPLVDIILDEAQQKGTGKWTSQNALDLGVPTHTINAAVEGRIISGLKAERIEAAKVFGGPKGGYSGDRGEFFEQVRDALYVSMLISYAQGIALMQAASKDYDYDLDIADIARIWRGGCIIRAGLLEDVRKVYTAQPDLPNLLLASPFKEAVEARQADWRAVIQAAVGMGVPVPGMAASLAYFDAYRSARLPANLTQAQRDFFGSHTYRRLDRDGVFHTEWEA